MKKCKCDYVRTTIELPDTLYRTLKARAALSGVPVRDLIRRLLEQGLRQPAGGEEGMKRREPPPVIVPPRGIPLPALPREALRRLDEEEDEERHGRSARR